MYPDVRRRDEGLLAIQEFIGPYEDFGSATHSNMSRADALATEGQWDQAQDLYRRVLADNPYHTVALNNLAYAEAKRGDLLEALRLQQATVEIELQMGQPASGAQTRSSCCGREFVFMDQAPSRSRRLS